MYRLELKLIIINEFYKNTENIIKYSYINLNKNEDTYEKNGIYYINICFASFHG
jgi:hypothetical protein